MSDNLERRSLRHYVQWAGLIGGPLLALVCFLTLPSQYARQPGSIQEFSTAGRATMAVMVWMAVWWLTESVEISVTALLPLAVFPMFGIASMKDAAATYADPLIFLFMGGFLLALSMQRWGLDRRLALRTLRMVGTRPVNMIGGFMLVTAMLSAFVSNTATTAMMLPIAVSVVALVSDRSDGEVGKNFATCLMLGVAYAASIGGLATLIGSPPNVFAASFLRSSISPEYRTDLSFARWSMFGVPFTVIFLPISWFLLTRFIYPIRLKRIEGGDELIASELRDMGRQKPGEWITWIVFILTATLWMVRPLLVNLSIPLDSGDWQPLHFLTDAGIAMLGAMALFVIPADVAKRQFVMDWTTARRLPWGILILFGGGLSLASAVRNNGVAEFLGSLTQYMDGLPPIVVMLVVVAAIVFLTELTSNLATAATMLPILAAMAPGLGVHPYWLVLPAAIACSCAFMLPVATPPNAIVFASGEVTMDQMMKAGIWLNLVAIVLIVVMSQILLGPMFGI